MIDSRIRILAKNIIEYSLEVKEGDKVLIDLIDGADDMGTALIEEVYRVKGVPFVNYEAQIIRRAVLLGATQEQYDLMLKYELLRMKDMDCYVVVRKNQNLYQLSDIPPERKSIYTNFVGKLHLGQRVPHTRWCILAYPSDSFAQQSGMSTPACEDYYFDVCCVDYKKMAEKMKPLKELMDKTEKVRIVSENTDLKFSIKGMTSGVCAGKANIPDGEVCMGVEHTSVNGTISYNVPSNYQGFVFSNIVLTFKDGKIITAVANDTEKLNSILDIDEGARYIGEFAIGTNTAMKHHITDTLFDEKMAGSIHFTPGNGDGNKSAIHWDIIQSHTLPYGGGEIWFDDVLIRKDGQFIIPALMDLNEGIA